MDERPTEEATAGRTFKVLGTVLLLIPSLLISGFGLLGVALSEAGLCNPWEKQQCVAAAWEFAVACLVTLLVPVTFVIWVRRGHDFGTAMFGLAAGMLGILIMITWLFWPT